MTTPRQFPNAEWITAPIVGSARVSAPAPYFRKSFRIEGKVKSAVLRVTALGVYECELNGRRLGDEIFAPGWTDYWKRVQYQEFDVAGLLREGENALGAIVGDGWYCGFVAWKGRQVYGDRPRFLSQLEVVLENGSTVTVGTDESWKTSAGPIIESDLLMGETYDARLELGDWSQPGYDDDEWQRVVASGGRAGKGTEIVPRLGPPVRRMGELKPAAERAARGGLIYDFGQNFAGRAKLEIRGAKRGAVVKLTFAEILNPDGSQYTENLRAARATDYYVCKGAEIENWEPRFTFHGFRYVEVNGVAPKEAAVKVTGVVLHSDTPPTGTFRCSHPLLNQLQHNIVWGQKSNFLEVPTDCPQRDERLGWTGDAQVFIRTACFNMDVREFFHKWMRDARDSQTERGGIPAVIPNNGFLGARIDEDGGPAWADAMIICPWTIYLCYGDEAILEENYEAMARFMDFMGKHRSLDGIRSHPDVDTWGGFGDWLALDGSGQTEGRTARDLIGTAFFAYDAGIMAQVAARLGRKGDAEKYEALRAQVVEAFQRRFVTPEGLIVSDTQTAAVLALHFDLLPEALRATVAAGLARDIRKRGNHLATGFVGTPYLLEVLETAGYLDLAYTLLEQESFPSWLFPVKNGATTIWERWDGWTPEKGFQDKGMNSFNHYAYGAVGAWMYRTVAGLEVDPAEPGYRHIVFRPRPGGSITWAEAALKTAHGEAGIRWEIKEAAMEVRLTVPEGCRATFLPPAGYDAAASRHGNGSHSLTLAKTATNP